MSPPRCPHNRGKAFRFLLLARFAVPLAFVATSGATIYHVDPATGSMTNPGTETQPWSTLQAVFEANKTFVPGDVILLKSGYHGSPEVKGSNTGEVAIRADDGHTPRLRTLVVRSGSRWNISGLDVCPENSAPGAYLDANLIEVQASASFITIRDCLVRGAFDVSGWSVANWQDRAGNGIRVVGPNSVVSGNRFENVGFGIRVSKTATASRISRNVVYRFCMDGAQVLADDSVFEYNRITDSYVDDSNHDDFFQGWSGNTSGGEVGLSTIYRVTVRGNTFISRTEPANALSTDPQGIGCFDGMFEDWVIENNVIATNTYHGISLYGAVNCKIVNNTVVENPTNTTTGKRPWIQIYQHKNDASGNAWPVVSSGNLIRNNVSASMAIMVANGGMIDQNLKTTSYATWFTDFPAFDFSLKATAPGVGAGETAGAPAIDILELARSVPYDIGAYEYREAAADPYQQWLIANGLPADGSGNGAPDASPSGDGIPNEMKFALGLPANSNGYEGRLVPGGMVVDGNSYNSLTYIHPEPAPVGVVYAVKVSSDLRSWSATPVIQVSSVVEGSLRRVTMRDSVPVTGGGSRFMRLEVSR